MYRPLVTNRGQGCFLTFLASFFADGENISPDLAPFTVEPFGLTARGGGGLVVFASCVFRLQALCIPASPTNVLASNAGPFPPLPSRKRYSAALPEE